MNPWKELHHSWQEVQVLRRLSDPKDDLRVQTPELFCLPAQTALFHEQKAWSGAYIRSKIVHF